MRRWDQLKSLFATAVDLPPGERPRFLDEACTGDAALREELERMLEADSRDGEGILAAVEGAARALFTLEGVVGSRIGPYLIESEIGAGGMGAVYRAVRDDEQYKKRVAVKLIRRGLDTDDILDRFRHERQILANLEHPYIARLLDGGTAPDGRPFLVMEYVHGEPLDTYCGSHSLDVRERCRLFLKVCQAVAYAHRNLVVHRDLKPGNILVTEDGSPKLLDFGVAKMLDSELTQGRTALTMAMRPLTPDYASPEQIRAGAITTATDVYSLGAILYELLTGHRAHRFTSYSLREVERVVCNIDPPRPSDAAPGLHLEGDLDAIVLMAMRKEPALRYTTVEQLSSDLENYLARRPVAARHGNLTYRSRKFLRRHRMAIAVSGLLAVTLIGGATAAAVEAQRAMRERARAEQERARALESQRRAEASRQAAERESQEAQRQRGYAENQRQQAEMQKIAAETQRQIADRRFQQVRQLAGKFLLDFHDAIANLPGSTPARKMVVETGLQYFDTLVREAHGNRDLLEEIARGYDRLGDVQGNPYYPNLGDLPGAMVSYQKAAEIRKQVMDPSPEFLRDRINGGIRVAQLLHTKGDMAGSARMLRETLALGEGTPASDSYVGRRAILRAYDAFGDLANRRGDYHGAVEPYTKELEIAAGLAREGRDPAVEQGLISIAHSKLGDIYTRLGKPREAIEHLRAALKIDEALAAANPNDASRLRRLYIDHGILSFLFTTNDGAALARPGEARAVMQTMVDLAARMVAADSNNETALMDAMAAESILGDWLRNQGEVADALLHYRKSLESAEKQMARGAQTFAKHDALVQAHHRLAIGLIDAGEFEEAVEHFRKAEEYLARAEKQSPGLSRLARRHAEIDSGRAVLYSRQKKWGEAIAGYNATIAIFEDLRKRDPKNDADLGALPELYIKVADCFVAAGESGRAIGAMESALDRLRELESRRPLLDTEQQQRKDAAAKLAAWR